jgi:hypothetical protein
MAAIDRTCSAGPTGLVKPDFLKFLGRHPDKANAFVIRHKESEIMAGVKYKT